MVVTLIQQMTQYHKRLDRPCPSCYKPINADILLKWDFFCLELARPGKSIYKKPSKTPSNLKNHQTNDQQLLWKELYRKRLWSRFWNDHRLQLNYLSSGNGTNLYMKDASWVVVKVTDAMYSHCNVYIRVNLRSSRYTWVVVMGSNYCWEVKYIGTAIRPLFP